MATYRRSVKDSGQVVLSIVAGVALIKTYLSGRKKRSVEEKAQSNSSQARRGFYRLII